ncbi:DNA-processing protein DprA [Streptomyces tritici]|uniref:DNA-processing protein DprA n=1 Tax=Streptomyces tritici TaxID=2054410 RepID=UPI003AF1AFD3
MTPPDEYRPDPTGHDGAGRLTGAGREPGREGIGPPPGAERDPGPTPLGEPDEAERPHGPPGGADGERAARAALTRVVEPGDEQAGQWLRRYGPAEFLARLRHPGDAGASFPGTGEKRVQGWRHRAAQAAVDTSPERDLDAVAALGGRFVVPGDAEWPRQLDDLGDARPLGLWLRGPADLRTWALRSVAVVGARACTPYGAHTATALAGGLAEQGWVVVSGAAFGIDGAAHRGALAAQGATVAVLACGVDTPYPRGHAGLLLRIAEQGLVLGELPPGSHPTPARFILRNRVIAALTRGTVVVEAEYRSGSLVTARAAQRLGRHTMGVPGPVTSGLSAGVHELLRGPATLVTDAAEVIELVGAIGELAPDRRGPILPRDLLDPDCVRVLDALPAYGATSAQEIARRGGTPPDETVARLYELHSLGFVERVNGSWRLTNTRRSASNARRGGS